MKKLSAITGAFLAVILLAGSTMSATPPTGGEVLLAPEFNCERKPDHWKCVIPTPTPTATPTAAPTPTPTVAPTPTPTIAPTATPTTAPTATPTATATATIPPTPTPTPSVGGDFILIDRATLMAKPMSGAAWNNLLSWANKPVAEPDLSNQDDQDDIVALAKAIVYARTGTAKYKTETIQMLNYAVGTEYPGDTLGISRNLGALVLAADFIGFNDASWKAWLSQLRTWVNPDRSYTLISIHDKRPNNWGGHAGASRIATDLYLKDFVELDKAWKTYQGFMGNRAVYAGFVYGELSWQCNSSQPVGINPKGCTKNGNNIDGVLPDDQRRGGTFSWPPPNENYVWEALQGVTLQTELLHRAGYDSYNVSDKALLRAVQWEYNINEYPPSGDDNFIPYMINHMYGTTYTENAISSQGKGFGFTDWLYN